MAQPPYSPAYATALLQLLHAIHAISPQALVRARFSAELHVFLQACSSLPPPSSVDAARLQAVLGVRTAA